MFLLIFSFILGFGIAALKEQDRKIKNMLKVADEIEERARLSYKKENDIDRLYEKFVCNIK